MTASGLLILSHYQVDPLLGRRSKGGALLSASPDLNRSLVDVILRPDGVEFSGHPMLPWESLEMIAGQPNACFVVENGIPRPIQAYSGLLDRYYSLYPTAKAPTMLVSGIPMHRIKDVDPYQDTLNKIQAANPVGRVLDTATGLGYTAIQAAGTASQVITVELDPTTQEITRYNPWSQELFNNPHIQQIYGDSFEEISRFEDGSFTRIIHDPPVFSLAGELYSLAFYQQAFRVLRHAGRMFHYIGNPESKSGAGLTSSVTRRLKEAGFSRVVAREQAFGVIAYKE
jgi:uncharacterized protein